MCRIQGPFKDREKWRVRVVDSETKKKKSYLFPTEKEARAAMPRLERAYRRPAGVPIDEALEEYRGHLAAGGMAGDKPNRPRSIDTTMNRLKYLFQGKEITGELTPSRMQVTWSRFVITRGRRSGKLPSVNTEDGVLKQSRTFVRWLLGKGWIKEPVLDGIRVVGKRRRGKPQFVRTLDDSRVFLDKALFMARTRDDGALAAAVALYTGLRASEIAERLVGELDDHGRILVITAAKTDAGIRRLVVPETLRPLLLRLVEGRQATERLFGTNRRGKGVDRHWVRRAVERVCRAAGVSTPKGLITPHGLRGVHSTLATDAGMSSLAVAAAMGHESFDVTSRHYVQPGAIDRARIGRVVDALQ